MLLSVRKDCGSYKAVVKGVTLFNCEVQAAETQVCEVSKGSRHGSPFTAVRFVVCLLDRR